MDVVLNPLLPNVESSDGTHQVAGCICKLAGGNFSSWGTEPYRLYVDRASEALSNGASTLGVDS